MKIARIRAHCASENIVTCSKRICYIKIPVLGSCTHLRKVTQGWQDRFYKFNYSRKFYILWNKLLLCWCTWLLIYLNVNNIWNFFFLIYKFWSINYWYFIVGFFFCIVYCYVHNYFRKGDEIQKLNFIQTLPSLLATDTESCITRVIPKVQQSLATASTEFHIAASSTFKTILEQKLVNHNVFSRTFLQSILDSLEKRDPGKEISFICTIRVAS